MLSLSSGFRVPACASERRNGLRRTPCEVLVSKQNHVSTAVFRVFGVFYEEFFCMFEKTGVPRREGHARLRLGVDDEHMKVAREILAI